MVQQLILLLSHQALEKRSWAKVPLRVSVHRVVRFWPARDLETGDPERLASGRWGMQTMRAAVTTSCADLPFLR